MVKNTLSLVRKQQWQLVLGSTICRASRRCSSFTTIAGTLVSLADKLDTLVAISPLVVILTTLRSCSRRQAQGVVQILRQVATWFPSRNCGHRSGGLPDPNLGEDQRQHW